MKNIIYICLGLPLLLLAACIETYEAHLDGAGEGCLVVEGNILSDSVCTFYLSRTVGLDATFLPSDYTDVEAEVAVVGSDGSRWNGVKADMGTYEVSVGVLNENVTYSLEIRYDGDTYTSEPQKPLPTSPIDELTFEQEGEGDIKILLSTKAGKADESEYYFWNYVEDWEVRTPYSCRFVYEPDARDVVEYDRPPYCQGWVHRVSSGVLVGSTESSVNNALTRKLIYSIPSNSRSVSLYYSTLLVQRNLSKGEYEYHQARKKYSEDMGGLFTPQPSELPTNIVCSNSSRVVVGYVGCNMNVSEKRIFIPRSKITYTGKLRCPEVPVEPGWGFQQMYAAGYQIIDYWLIEGGISYTWGHIECVDVRTWGANPDRSARPDWWPSDYVGG